MRNMKFKALVAATGLAFALSACGSDSGGQVDVNVEAAPDLTGAAKERFNAAELAKAAVIAMGGQGAGGRGLRLGVLRHRVEAGGCQLV